MRLTTDLLDTTRIESSVEPEIVLGIRDRVEANRRFTSREQEVFERRKRMIAAVAVEPVAEAFERLIGGNDLLPINYLMLGYLQSKSVGRIRYLDRSEGEQALATGFLVSENLILTNHHVFPVDDLAQFQAFADDPVIEFNFEFDIDGNRSSSVLFELDPTTFLHTSKELDMALIAVRPFDKTGNHAMKDQGYLVLNRNLGKAEVGDFAGCVHQGGVRAGPVREVRRVVAE
jgi:endonuclease G